MYRWDITYVPTRVREVFLYLYLVMDVYCRKIVGWQVYEEESSALAADLITDICQREGIGRDQVQGFVDWYKQLHLHSAIKFVTPEQRYNGQDVTILQQRKQLI